MGDNNISQSDLIAFNLDVVIKYIQFFDFSFFILKPNQKFVEIAIDHKHLHTTIVGYQLRGINEIYLRQADYDKFTKLLRMSLAQNTSYSDAILDMRHLYSSIRGQLLSLGLNPLTIRAAEEMNNVVIEQLSHCQGITQLMNDFKNRLPDNFLSYIMLSYISTSMINMFSWRGQQIKLKIGMASLLCDVCLTQKDIDRMHREDYYEWPETLKMYPMNIARLLSEKSSLISAEVIQMIEMHRELPDGSGFPRHMHHPAIPQLPSIFIVAYNFVMKMMGKNLDENTIPDVLQDIYSNFNQGIFHQATLSLFSTLGTTLPT